MAEHNELGHLGENVAVDYLVEHGYAIRERNWRNRHLELDIVAEKEGELYIVEVKTRTDTENGEPMDAMHVTKRRRLIRAADAYLKINHLRVPIHFDVITIIGEQGQFKVEHIEDAFYPY